MIFLAEQIINTFEYNKSKFRPIISEIFTRKKNDLKLAQEKYTIYLNLKEQLEKANDDLEVLNFIETAANNAYKARHELVTLTTEQLFVPLDQIEEKQIEIIFGQIKKNEDSKDTDIELKKEKVRQFFKENGISGIINFIKRGYYPGSFEKKLLESLCSTGMIKEKNGSYICTEAYQDHVIMVSNIILHLNKVHTESNPESYKYHIEDMAVAASSGNSSKEIEKLPLLHIGNGS